MIFILVTFLTWFLEIRTFCMMPNYGKESVRPLHWPLWMVWVYCVFYKPSSLMSFFSLLWW